MRNNSSSDNFVIHSETWFKPVLYMFAGLIAMALLTAAAFFTILALSYWKLCADSEGLTNRAASAPGGGENHEMQYVDPGNTVVVVMPGHEKPTYLGKPIPCANTKADTVAGV